MIVYMGGRPGLTFEQQQSTEKFWRRCSPQDRNACITWLGAVQQNGYGMFYVSGLSPNSVPAHRASYYLFRGEIPPGMQVRHRCHNPACVNPYHLVLGTVAENARDKREHKLGINHLEQLAW